MFGVARSLTTLLCLLPAADPNPPSAQDPFASAPAFARLAREPHICGFGPSPQPLHHSPDPLDGMPILQPAPNVNYHLHALQPDPDVDYKIRIVNPAGVGKHHRRVPQWLDRWYHKLFRTP